MFINIELGGGIHLVLKINVALMREMYNSRYVTALIE